MSTKPLDPADIPVVILAGGLGTRLREETERVPKPLVEIGEKPMLWHIMKLYSHHGFRRFVICLGYKSWLIKQFFLSYREQVLDFTLELGSDADPRFENSNGDEKWEITLAETGLHTATGGRLWKVRDYIDADTFMLTYGDGLGSIDISALLAHHRAEGRIGTVTGVHPASRFGEISVQDGRVLEFAEKPSLVDGWVSGGFFVFQRAFFDYMTDEPDMFFEHAPLERLTADGQLSVFQHDGFWLGMDTYRELKDLNDRWAAGNAPWKVWDDAVPVRRRRFALA
jgi:glucose-1-phosphate cytidylyltransferase